MKIQFLKKNGKIRTLEGTVAPVQQFPDKGIVTLIEQLRDENGKFKGTQVRNVKLESIIGRKND